MAIQPVTMDKISHVTPAPAVENATTSSDTKNIQTQITSKQQHMKKISSDDTITATEKEEKRRQLQKEIDELNRKLEQKKQEQEEKAKEAAKKQEQAANLKEELLKKDVQKKDMLKEISAESVADKEKSESKKQPIESDDPLKKEEPKHTDMPVKEIQEMLSADYLVQKEQMQKQVDQKAENTIQVMKSEIKQDKVYGADTTKKEAELDSLQQKQNFWSDAQKQTTEANNQKDNQTQTQQTTLNANAKVVIDQI